MGTSTNQGSPRTPNWLATRTALGDMRVPVERQGVELWRAAANDRDGKLTAELGSPLILAGLQVAETARNPVDAASRFDAIVSSAGQASVILDLAKRALIRSVASASGAEGFAAELFAETASYFASRDLPSVVGAEGKTSTTSDAIALKAAIRDSARNNAARVEASTANAKAAATSGKIEPWHAYIHSVLDSLKSGRK